MYSYQGKVIKVIYMDLLGTLQIGYESFAETVVHQLLQMSVLGHSNIVKLCSSSVFPAIVIDTSFSNNFIFLVC